MSSDGEEQFKVYQKDSRIPCRYGAKCYQKNPAHHEKYKHPPKKDGKPRRTARNLAAKKKRKNSDRDDDDESTENPEKKLQKQSSPRKAGLAAASSSLDDESKNTDPGKESDETSKDGSENSGKPVSVSSLLKDCDVQGDRLSASDARTVIARLFLTAMPDDFFHLYDLCKSISSEYPLEALKDFRLLLVGPYDVFREKFLETEVASKEEFLAHSRYFYDPPEFQTVLRADEKDGLHFGYWRDDDSQEPVFVGRNRANESCVIEPVAENVFGVVDRCMEERIQQANPFEKPRLMRLHSKLKNYAKEKNVTLEKKTAAMQAREKKVVARTFHKAGIVVPYNKKTQLGYRPLAATEKDLEKTLKQIKEAASADERKKPMSKLEEVVRLATIAADECDFGTCLELGHDLFSSGVVHVQNKALQMLSIAYAQLERPNFLKIVKAHLKNRKTEPIFIAI